MKDVDLDGRKYRIGKLNAFKQLHLFRRILPLLAGMGESLQTMQLMRQGEVGGSSAFFKSLGPVANAIAEMSEEDSEWIIKTCLSCCQVFNGSNWAVLTTSDGQLMFGDMDLKVMLDLSMEVIQENLGSFFEGPLANGSAGEAQLSPSAMSQ